MIKSRKALAWKLSSLAMGAFAIVSFQNCTQPAQVDTSSTDDKTDFAYEAKLDQVAYMSCPKLKPAEGIDPDTDSYFSFRAGAYKDEGLAIKDSFFQLHSKKTPERIADTLSRSKANKSTVLQLAIRKTGDLDSVISVTGAAKQARDFSNLLRELGTMEMSTHLVYTGLDYENAMLTGKKVRFVRDETRAGARMEGSLYFGEAESIAADVRNNYLGSGTAILALTFFQPAEGGTRTTDVRSPYTIWPEKYRRDPGTAYGMGYNLGFKKPDGAVGLMDRDPATGALRTPARELEAYPTAWMISVAEKNLLVPGDKTGIRPWVCKPEWRFKIIRPEDTTAAGCTRTHDPEVLTEDQKRVRFSIRTEDFYIDWTNRCIIPKKGDRGCYGNLKYVEYNPASAEGCDKNSNDQTNSNKSRVCVAWASICARQ